MDHLGRNLLWAHAIPQVTPVATGIHLLWTSPPGAGYALDGWEVRRRDATGRPKISCRTLSGLELEILHSVLRLFTDVADFALHQVPGSPDPSGSIQPPRYPFAYGIRLPLSHRVVEVHAGVRGALAFALRAGKAVAARVLDSPSGTQIATFAELDVDEVQLYTITQVSTLEVCLDQMSDPIAEEAEWATATVLAERLQLPIRALDPALITSDDEKALAFSRLLPGEGADDETFESVAELLNATVETGAPQWATTITRDEPHGPFIELRPWPYALVLLVDPAWRRMLGFGLLDRAADLVAGQAYDYRVTGRFQRREVEGGLHGFHTVPRGTTLPETFTLGAVSLATPKPAVVEMRPGPPADVLTATGRAGIALDGDPCLTLSFPSPVQRVTLELADGAALTWRTSTSEFLIGLPLQTFTGALPAERRVTIEPPDPVSTIELAGTGFLFGVDEHPGPDDTVTRSVVLRGVVFADTPPPDPPATLATDNLQAPVLPGDTQPPAPLGFTLRWPPPPAAGTPAGLVWPVDLGIVAHRDVLGYLVEHRRVDTDEAFAPLGPLVFGSRGGHGAAPPLGPGVDLEVAFPADAPPTPPVPTDVSLDDVPVDVPPGSTHQYRILSVDGIGRRSTTPTEGPVVRLEKHRAPPPPSDVRASVLQSDDPDLAVADRALLGASTNAIVLEWSWTDRERTQDDLATEFRVYWQPQPPDTVRGEVTGPAVPDGPLLATPARLDRPVDADAMRGRWLTVGESPFLVASHTAGQDITIRFEPSAIDSSLLPAEAAFEFRPLLSGAEQRPSAWAERRTVVPITAEEQYRILLRDALTLDADRPRVRVWVGVSTADDQDYVPDTFPGEARPGNESAVAAAPVAARYLGRPPFTVPPPLPDVPELVTAEPSGDAVVVTVDPAALLPSAPVPAGHRVQLERIALSTVVSFLGANADDTIRAELPDGTTTSYTLGNPDDQAALLAQIRTGTPARVEGRFLVDFVLRFTAALDPLWRTALPTPVPFGPVSDTLPSDAERHLHRIRLVDAAGHASAGVAVLPQIVRVPSLRSPGPPQLRAPSSRTATLDVEARVRDAFDLAHVLLFADDSDGLAPSDETTHTAAALLRLPNRRDLYPADGIRLRLADGTLLAPTAVLDAAAGAPDPPDRVLTTTLAPGPRRRVAVWAVALSRDGVPSRLTGPVVALTAGGP
jgi:hypothetical protein